MQNIVGAPTIFGVPIGAFYIHVIRAIDRNAFDAKERVCAPSLYTVKLIRVLVLAVFRLKPTTVIVVCFLSSPATARWEER